MHLNMYYYLFTGELILFINVDKLALIVIVILMTSPAVCCRTMDREQVPSRYVSLNQ